MRDIVQYKKDINNRLIRLIQAVPFTASLTDVPSLWIA